MYFVVAEGINHPGKLCEGAGLANVRPPPIVHKLKMCWAKGTLQLSKPQILAVLYATQSNLKTYKINGVDYRQGFLLGDGTGVGKTLTLAATAIEAFDNGFVTQALWIVPNQDLIQAAKEEVRRLSDVEVYDMASFKEKRLSEVDLKDAKKLKDTSTQGKNGIFFCSYNFLASSANQAVIRKFLGENYTGMVRLLIAMKSKAKSFVYCL